MRGLLRRSIPAIAILVALGLVLPCLQAKAPKATIKDLMHAELTAIRNDVANDQWKSAGVHANKLNGYWTKYLRSHPEVKEITVDSFNNQYASLRKHLKERSKALVYADLAVLRTIVFALKA